MEMMVMMAGAANHGKRAHAGGGYFGGQAAGAGSSSEQLEFGRTQAKKPRAATKVKNDRVGDRVAMLRQLVSPFGKSDTASVLQEATGYIKFLHQQLQVLSQPYLRDLAVGGGGGDGDGVPTRDGSVSLRSRGLCAAPVELAQQLTQSNGADMWAPVPAPAPANSTILRQ